jgi:aryl-alcohol dehydrogenase-like predicted oxidoreductase
VAAALDEGITTFDTADVYGSPDYGAAERVLGDALSGVSRG